MGEAWALFIIGIFADGAVWGRVISVHHDKETCLQRAAIAGQVHPKEPLRWADTGCVQIPDPAALNAQKPMSL